MKHYIDITLIPDSESGLGFIWHKVYQQIHLALVENKIADNQSSVALSWPEYGDKRFPLGKKLRLFAATKAQLESLDVHKWLSRLVDYTHVKSIQAVPDNVQQYASFTRKQVLMNPEKLARRRAKRKGETLAQALTHYEGYEAKESKLPFINVKSLSQDESFKLFIQQELLSAPAHGACNCYGLSQTQQVITLPVFA